MTHIIDFLMTYIFTLFSLVQYLMNTFNSVGCDIIVYEDNPRSAIYVVASVRTKPVRDIPVV